MHPKRASHNERIYRRLERANGGNYHQIRASQRTRITLEESEPFQMNMHLSGASHDDGIYSKSERATREEHAKPKSEP